MRLKLDECLDIHLAEAFLVVGHDAKTVHQENLSGFSDQVIYATCIREGRTLITQDMDFSNPFRFSPLASKGIIVMRNPSQLLPEARRLVDIIISKLYEENPEGHPWVVDFYGIRVWPS